MNELDIIAPQFRRAADRWPEALTLANHYQAVEQSWNGNAHGLIAAIKSFVESVCLTILGEFGKTMPSSNPSTTEMLVEALRTLGLENTGGASKMSKLLSAHNKLADALTDIRNESDPVAHGKDAFLDTLTANEQRAFLITCDTILALLLAAHDGTEPDLHYTREPYDRFLHLHERIDRSVVIDAQVEDDYDERQLVVITLRTDELPDGIELRVEPSRLLYAIDRTAYVEVLATSVASAALEVETPAIPAPVVEEPSVVVPISPLTEIVAFYNGALGPFKEALAQYLETLVPVTTFELDNGANLNDSLLATAEKHMGLDWLNRATLQSAMKVALRRTLIQFGIDRTQAEEIAEHLLSWFKQAEAQPVGGAGI